MSDNIIQWSMQLRAMRFIGPANDVVDVTRKITSISESAAPAVASIGKALDGVGDEAARAAKEIANVGKSTVMPVATTKAFSESATAAAKAAGLYTDTLGRLHAANGRFLKRSDFADVDLSALPVSTKPVATSLPNIASDATEAASKVGSLSDQFDALQKSAKFDANKVLNDQSIARGLAHLKALRAASRAAAAPTDAEKMMAGAMPDQLRPIQKLSVAQRAARRMLQGLSEATGGRGLSALNSLISGYERAAPVIAKMGEAARAAAPLLKGLGAAALTAGTAGVALAGGALAGAGFFAKSVLQAQAFKEDVGRGLTTVLKSREAAKEALELSARTADMIGAGRQEVAGQTLDLLTKGFGLDRTQEIIKRLADLRIVDPRADLGRVQVAISQIAGNERLLGEELNQLSEAGLERGAVLKAIGNILGKSNEEVLKLQSAGKIDAKTAIQGILDAIKEQTGGGAAGAAAAAAARNSLSGIYRRFENLPNNFLTSINVDGPLKTLKASANEFLDYFEMTGKNGDKIATALEGSFGALVEGLFGVNINQEGGITKALDDIFAGIIQAKPAIKEFGENVRKAFKFGVDVVGFVGDIISLKESIASTTATLGPFGTLLQMAFLPVVSPLSIVIGAFGVLKTAIHDITNYGIDGWVQGIAIQIAVAGIRFYNEALNLGTRIIDGITSGISAGLSRVTESISTVANGAIGEAKAILGIRSPSKVFEEIGMYTAMGFERGIAANDTGALADLVAPPGIDSFGDITMGAQRAGAAIAGGQGGGNVINLSVNVDARGATASDATHISEMVSDAVVRTLENMAIGVGAAA